MKITFDILMPEGATIEELIEFLNFEYLGHKIKSDNNNHFYHEGLEVEDYEIEE